MFSFHIANVFTLEEEQEAKTRRLHVKTLKNKKKFQKFADF